MAVRRKGNVTKTTGIRVYIYIQTPVHYGLQLNVYGRRLHYGLLDDAAAAAFCLNFTTCCTLVTSRRVCVYNSR